MKQMHKELTLIVDIDGTICPIKGKEMPYEDLEPYEGILNKLRYYRSEGARIVLFTSRNMNSYQGSIGMINKYTAPVLYEWLNKWNIPYDEIIYGKPWPGTKGVYIDDRSIRPDEFLSLSIEQIEELCDKSRKHL